MGTSRTTRAQIHFGTAAQMGELEDESIDLVVTSPPYPMIEMWDEVFASQDTHVGTLLEESRSGQAFARMHTILDGVWNECSRVLKEGGILCINIGDATRSVDGDFQLYPNHARVVEACSRLGLKPLPGILWRKSTNKPNKFMGSGMLPPNAYVTLEHEHILIFRKGQKRRVARREDRYESAFFWAERNRWFSDVWTDLSGTSQMLSSSHDGLRERSAAFPLEIPYRLIAMYSIAGDTVLDPFWGTGTTSLAAALLGRNSIGYEIDHGFESVFHCALNTLPSLSRDINRRRLEEHRSFVEARNTPCKYRNATYDVDVVTRQERHLTLYDVTAVEPVGEGSFRFAHKRHPGDE